MKHEIKVWLEDIKRSIDEIYEFLPDNKDFLNLKKISRQKKLLSEI